MRTYKYYIYLNEKEKAKIGEVSNISIYRSAIRFGKRQRMKWWNAMDSIWMGAYDDFPDMVEITYDEFIKFPYASHKKYDKLKEEWLKHSKQNENV